HTQVQECRTTTTDTRAGGIINQQPTPTQRSTICCARASKIDRESPGEGGSADVNPGSEHRRRDCQAAPHVTSDEFSLGAWSSY
ncbi:unnamed protein product, partial [Pylaiella littoralis]